MQQKPKHLRTKRIYYSFSQLKCHLFVIGNHYIHFDHIRFPWRKSSQVFFLQLIICSFDSMLLYLLQVKWKNKFCFLLQKPIKKLDYIIFSASFLLNWTISIEFFFYLNILWFLFALFAHSNFT